MSNDNMNEIIENEEIVTQEPEKLDNPLVVHKKGDASYEESAVAVEMNETHTDDDSPTLTRHRFRKKRKSHGPLIAVLVIIVILAGAFSALYVTGNISFLNNNKTTKAKKTTTTEATTSIEDMYKGTIVVKDTYVFVDGTEVKGTEGLQKALEYEDKSTTAYTIIDEGANSDFLNFEVLQILEQMGFYGKDTVITHKAKTGLIAEAETTTLPPETTTTTKKAKTTKKTSEKKKETTKNQE